MILVWVALDVFGDLDRFVATPDTGKPKQFGSYTNLKFYELSTLLPEYTPVASYEIEVSLDTEDKVLSGREIITYTNQTRDPIPDLVFHLYLNAFRDRGSFFLREMGSLHRGYSWDPRHPGWIEIESIRLGNGALLSVEEIEDGTLARSVLPKPIAPGDELVVVITFNAQLPKVFARTGFAQDASGDDFFVVGQWFPKLGVWQNGYWVAYPFHANSEFFADFGAYDVEITLPEEYTTGGVGVLGGVQNNGDGSQTVTYHAEGVIDFAWTASPNFQEAVRQTERGEIVYLWLPEHAWTVERVLNIAEAALHHYSEWFGPYPYDRLTIVDVPADGEGAGGMEYPTLVTAGVMSILGVDEWTVRAGWERSLEVVVAHEVAHQWWQSMVAFNEAEEPWLDEGFTDYSTLRLLDALYGPSGSAFQLGGWQVGYLDARRMEYLMFPGVPMYGRAWEFSVIEYPVATYSKPDLALLTLERSLGSDVMLAIMRDFFKQYRFAHPTTEDFRRVAERVSAQDLAWFFDGLVYGADALNYSVTSINGRQVNVTREGDLIIPTEVKIVFESGEIERIPWDGDEKTRLFEFPNRSSISQVRVDPDNELVVDLRWADNGLLARPDLWSWVALVTRWVYQLQSLLLAMGGL